MKWFLVAVIVLVLILHQDFWFWTDKTLVLGILPIGLAYHAAYMFLASLTMALLVKYAWPSDLERETSRAVVVESEERA